MKEPLTSLPWVISYPKVDSYRIANKDTIIQNTTDYYDWACCSKDAEYIVQAANEFPEAIELLELTLESIPRYEYGQGERYETELYSKVNEFLTKLEKDEENK